jgi:hypothetical protein
MPLVRIITAPFRLVGRLLLAIGRVLTGGGRRRR